MIAAQKFNRVHDEAISSEAVVLGTRCAALFGASMLSFLALVYVPALFFGALFAAGFAGVLYLAVIQSHRRSSQALPVERPVASQQDDSNWIQVRERRAAPRPRRATLSFRHVGSF